MKGLLLKDILDLKQQGKIYLVIIGFWLIFGLWAQESNFFGGVMMMMTVMIPLSAQGYDEKAKWDKYALTMPVSRKNVVMSKYILMLMVAVLCSLLAGVVRVLMTHDILESLYLNLIFMSLGIIFACIVMPFVFKFGTEKARFIILAVVAVPAILLMLMINMGISVSAGTLEKLLTFLPLIAAVVTVVSVKISNRIYEHKEF